VPLSALMKSLLEQEIQQARLPADFIDQIQCAYLPLAQLLDNHAQARGQPLLVSLQGPQGAGKSTLCYFLQILLEEGLGHQVAVLSLDDFYLTHHERQELAATVHPLLATRGVPGTHNLDLAVDTLEALLAGHQVSLPRFNKAVDDPFPFSSWPVAEEDVSIILFEGWCNHVPVQTEDQLALPINELEANEDPDGRWRHHVNQQLGLYHQRLFCLADLLVCLEIPDFDLVYQWRGLQEQRLIEARGGQGPATMNQQALRRFIQHFERLTRQAMACVPELADACLILDSEHRVVRYEPRILQGCS